MRRLSSFLAVLPSLFVFGRANVGCHFASGDCNWSIEPPWNIATAVGVPGTLGSSRQLTSDGPFLVAQGQFGGQTEGQTATNWLDPNEQMSILSFRYLKLGDAQLKVVKWEAGVETVLDAMERDPSGSWSTRNLVVPANTNPAKILFLASGIRTGHDLIAIDDVGLHFSNGVLAADQWSGIDSSNFQRGDIEQRDIRRSPLKVDHVKSTCMNVHCKFQGNACLWSQTNLRVLSSKIVSEGSGESLLISEPALLPVNANFRMDLFSSETSTTSVSQRSGSEESLVWEQGGGMTTQHDGWNRIFFPLKYSPLPSTMIIRSFSPIGGFVAITNTDIVDKQGQSLNCGANVPPIRPRHEQVIRLTAVQKIDGDDPATTATASATTTTSPKVSFARDSPVVAPSRSSFATLPIAPSSVHSKGTGHMEAILPIAPASQNLPLRSVDRTPSFPSFSAAPILGASSKFAPNTSSWSRFVSSQPLFLQQHLGEWAKKLGFDKMTTDEAEQKGRQLLESLSTLGDHRLSTFFSSIAPSVPPVGSSLNHAFASKIAQVITPPAGYGDDSKPFARQHMDLVVENAFQKYISQHS